MTLSTGQILNKQQKQSGFTLIEVILVVIVLSVIAAVTIPNFSTSYRHFQLKSAAEQLMYVMRYAQSRAVSKNIMVRLEFDDNNSKYWLTEQDEELSGNEIVYKRVSGRLGKRYSLTNKESLEVDKQVLNFYPSGQIEKTRLILCNDHDRCYTISTKEQRGHINIYDERIES